MEKIEKFQISMNREGETNRNGFKIIQSPNGGI